MCQHSYSKADIQTETTHLQVHMITIKYITAYTHTHTHTFDIHTYTGSKDTCKHTHTHTHTD